MNDISTCLACWKQTSKAPFNSSFKHWSKCQVFSYSFMLSYQSGIKWMICDGRGATVWVNRSVHSLWLHIWTYHVAVGGEAHHWPTANTDSASDSHLLPESGTEASCPWRSGLRVSDRPHVDRQHEYVDGPTRLWYDCWIWVYTQLLLSECWYVPEQDT